MDMDGSATLPWVALTFTGCLERQKTVPAQLLSAETRQTSNVEGLELHVAALFGWVAGLVAADIM
jgi:hypothetical protein